MKQNLQETLNSTDTLLNIAAFTERTSALGPGVRAGIWVQGCPFNCPGCISPEWQELKKHRIITPEYFSQSILHNPHVEGITISGGEPMLQSAGLTKMIQIVRKQREINVICFTGYKFQELLSKKNVDVANFLTEIDVLIDGQYKEHLDDNKGLRGSSNQEVHYLSCRLLEFELENHPRRTEIQILDGEVFLVGIPEKKTLVAFNNAHQRIKQMKARELFARTKTKNEKQELQ